MINNRWGSGFFVIIGQIEVFALPLVNTDRASYCPLKSLHQITVHKLALLRHITAHLWHITVRLWHITMLLQITALLLHIKCSSSAPPLLEWVVFPNLGGKSNEVTDYVFFYAI